MTIYVIIAIFSHADAQVVTANTDRGTAVNTWQDYMLNGNRFDDLLDHERQWLFKARVDMLQHGKTDKQDSGTFYRMQVLRG